MAQKTSTTLLLSSALLFGLATSVFAVGEGVSVMHGSVAVSGVGTSHMIIDSAGPSAIIHANTLNIGVNERLDALQCPTCNMLVRIFDSNPTQFLGTLNGQGNLIFLNRNGIFIGPTAQINIQGSFIATSLGISDANFLAGNFLFQGQIGDGLVENEGTIMTEFGGAYLIAPNVKNNADGVITGTDGSVVLAAGTEVLLTDQPLGNGLMVEVKAPAGEARNLGSLIADGGRVDMAGLVVNQEGLIQANTVGEKDGKIVLFGKNETNLKAGSQTIAKGGEKSEVNRLRVLAHSDSNTGKTTFEAGAIIDTSGGDLGGHGGLAFLHGKQVVNQGEFHGEVQNGFVEGQLLEVVKNLTVTNAELVSQLGSSDNVVFAAMNITMNNNGDNLGFGDQPQNLSFVAAEDLTIDNPDWTAFRSNRQPSNWHFRAGRDLKIFGAPGTGQSGSIRGLDGNRLDFEAGRDFFLERGARIHNGFEKAFEAQGFFGGDIFVDVGRDFISGSKMVGNELSGIRMESNTSSTIPAILAINVGRDIHGSGSNPAAITVNSGQATIKAGGQIGVAKNPKKKDPAKSAFHLQVGEDVEVDIEAKGDIYLGQVLDIGILESNRVNAIQNTKVSVRSNHGDIHLDPGRQGLEALADGGNFTDNALKRVYPASFTAKASEGNIFIDSDIQFWASPTGRLDFFAKHNIEGAVETQDLPNEFFSVKGLPIPPRSSNGLPLSVEQVQVLFGVSPEEALLFFEPRIDKDVPVSTPFISLVKGNPDDYRGGISTGRGGTVDLMKQAPENFLDDQVSTIAFKTELGDIQTLEVTLDSPNFKKAITIDSGRDINQVFFNGISAPEGLTARISAARDINMKALGSTVAKSGNAGVFFFGNGIGQIKAGRSLDLADSAGIEMSFKLGSNESNKGGLLDIEVQGKEDPTDPSPITGNLEMTSSKIVTRNGADIWIHGEGESNVIDGNGNVTDGVALGTLIGDVLHVDGNEIQEFVTPVTIDGTTPRLKDILNQSDDTYVVNGAPVFTNDGRQIYPTQHEGKPVVYIDPADGQQYVVLSAGTQTILAQATDVRIANPLPGNVNVGSNAGGGASVERGILTQRGGSIEIKAKGNIDVNLSRIMTLGGDNIALTSTKGNISAGSGGRDEVTNFVLEETVGFEEDGTPIKQPRVFQVPGSGIATFSPDDPPSLPFPVFDTPAITALKNLKVKKEFFGRDTSVQDAQIEQLVKEREPSFREEFGRFLDNTDFGNVRLTARNPQKTGTIIVPPAGIRGADILLDSDIVDFQGGEISGRVTFNTDSVRAPQGGVPVIGLASGAATSAGDKTSGTLNALGGSTGTVTTASSTTSATSATTSEALQSAVEETTETATQEAKAQAKGKNPKGQAAARRALNLREGVTIQVEVKERQTS